MSGDLLPVGGFPLVTGGAAPPSTGGARRDTRAGPHRTGRARPSPPAAPQTKAAATPNVGLARTRAAGPELAAVPRPEPRRHPGRPAAGARLDESPAEAACGGARWALAWSWFAIEDGLAVTQEQRGDDELVVAYDFATGRPLWIHADAARYATVIAGVGRGRRPRSTTGRVFALGATGILNALDLASGRRSGRTTWCEENGGAPRDVGQERLAAGRRAAASW